MASSFTSITNPAVLPTGPASGCDFSPDGKYLAITYNASPFLIIYSIDNGVFTKVDDPDIAPTAVIRECAFSADSKYLAATSILSPFILIYSISTTGVFTKVANPAILPGSISYGCAFSADNKYLAVAFSLSPYITIYAISTAGVFTKVTNPATLPTGLGFGCGFSPDGKYLAVGHNTSPWVTIYSISTAGVFTKVANPAILPTGIGDSIAFSPDNKYLAITHTTSPYITIYSISTAGVFTKVANPATLPTGSAGREVSFSPDGKYLAVSSNASPFITIYSISTAGMFTKVANPATLPTGPGQGCDFSPDGKYLAVSFSNTSPFMIIYVVDVPPVIDNLSASILSTHNDSITISFTASDEDNDPLTYQISINGVIYQAYQTYTGAVSLAIPASKFIVGTNSILVSVSDSKLTVTGELFITRTDTAPVLTGTLDKQVFHGVIGDAENDTIRWRALLNGTVLYDWSSYEASPISIDFILTKSQVHIGAANILRIEYEDDLGLAGNAEFDFVGVDYSARKKVLMPFIM